MVFPVTARLALPLAAAAFLNCAGPAVERIGYGGADPEAGGTRNESPAAAESGRCDVFIAKHRKYSGSEKPLGSVRIRDKGYSSRCKEWDVAEIIREEGCRLGAKSAHLRNIQEPSYFGSTCFQTEVDFYADDSSAFSERQPQSMAFDTLDNAGLRLALTGGGSGLTGGDQSRTGMVWTRQDNGETVESSVGQGGFGLLVGYGFNRRLSLDLEYRLRFATERPEGGNEDAKLEVFNKHYLLLNPRLNLFTHDGASGKFNLWAGAGIRYVWLELDEDFKSELRKVGISPRSETASGFGWTGSLGMERISRIGMLFLVGLELGHERPSFPGDVTVDAWDFGVNAALGYKFGR